MKMTFLSQWPSSHILYGLAVFIRLSICFVLGYLCTRLISLNLAYAFHLLMPKAEAVFLAAFIALLFYSAFVICMFCIQSLKKLMVYSLLIWLFLYLVSKWIA